MNLRQFNKLHQTRLGYAGFGLAELAMSYGFLSWGLSSGGWWLWVIALFLLVGSLQNFVHIIWRGKK